MKCFCCFSSGHICAPQKENQHGISIETFINLGKTFFLNISNMKCCTDLTLGKLFCMFIFFQKKENLHSLFKLIITTTQFFNLYFWGSLCLQSSQWIIPLLYDKSTNVDYVFIFARSSLFVLDCVAPLT